MKLSELIKAAQELQEKLGDQEVFSDDFYPINDIGEYKFDADITEWNFKKDEIIVRISDTR